MRRVKDSRLFPFLLWLGAKRCVGLRGQPPMDTSTIRRIAGFGNRGMGAISPKKFSNRTS